MRTSTSNHISKPEGKQVEEKKAIINHTTLID
jgi:hypothetical protein